MEIVLNNEQFNNFIKCLSILKDSCNDVDIKNGIIRQHINSRYCVFELDLNSLIDNIDIPIVELKKKLDILKTFKNNDNITISVDDTTYSISDSFSKIRFNKLSMLDNKFITVEELGHMFVLNNDDLILKCEINKTISNRIKSVSQNFDINTFKICFSGNRASIILTSQDKSQEAILLSNIETSIDINNVTTNIFNIPFIIDHDDDIIFELYQIQEDCIGKIITKSSGIDVVVYTNAILVDGNKEDGEEF